MDPISSATLHDTIQDGRIIEAKTLLTMHGDTFSEEERSTLDQELARLTNEAEALVARAELMEKEGRTEEAKDLYESVLLFAVDFPGIHSHIKRMEEALLLTRAVKKRSQRIRESKPDMPNAPRAKKSTPLLAAGLAMSIAATLLFLFFSKHQPQETTPPKAAQADSMPIAAIQPAISAEKTTSLPPIETKAEQPLPVETVNLPKDAELQATPPSPRQPEESSVPTTVPPPHDEKVQSTDGLYTVQPGDSLSRIADRELCNTEAWREMYQLNRERVPDPNKLQPGMQLQLREIKNRCNPTR